MTTAIPVSFLSKTTTDPFSQPAQGCIQLSQHLTKLGKIPVYIYKHIIVTFHYRSFISHHLIPFNEELIINKTYIFKLLVNDEVIINKKKKLKGPFFTTRSDVEKPLQSMSKSTLQLECPQYDGWISLPVGAVHWIGWQTEHQSSTNVYSCTFIIN